MQQVSKKMDSRSGISATKSARTGAAAGHSHISAGRTRNTSGGDSGGGGRLIITIDGKNVTPKNLIPMKGKEGVKQEGVEDPTRASKEGAAEDEAGEEETAPPPPPPAVVAAAERGKPPKPPSLSKDELERNVDIILSETETETLLNFPSLCVALDSAHASAISARNKAYEELVNSKADSDQYTEQHAQTLNNPHKMKEVLATPPPQESVEVNANPWDIHDTFATDPVPKHKQIQEACDKESAETVKQAIKKPGCLFTLNEPYDVSEQKMREPRKKEEGKSRSGLLAGGRSRVAGGGGLASTVSRTIGAGPTEGLPAQASSTAADMQQTTRATPQPEASPTPGAEEPPKPVASPDDPIPWKVGVSNPIPDELFQGLRVMERIVAQNVFHKQHMIYRNYPTLEELAKLDELQAQADEAPAPGPLGISGDVEVFSNRRSMAGSAEGGDGEDGDMAADDDGDEASPEGPGQQQSDKARLQDLFCFDAPQLTQGLTVTCAEWNRHNQDLLAVSYGDTAPVPNTSGGLVLFWSLKNPTYPERVIRTKTGVTALHFSAVHPNMVAAGTHDGSVQIWDLRRPTDVPLLKSGPSVSKHNDEKHTDIVWETRWVDRGPDKQPPELLVSVSSDGNVYQWSMKKGLEQTQLMQLKRLPNPNLGSNSVYGHKEGIVFRKSSGFCIDFPRHDPSTYLVGTEDGLVHRCSTSYNEQYLDTYIGHSGPVYKVRSNPFLSQAFLTCSADWTMKLWTTKPIPGHQADTALLTFQSQDLCDAVNDVCWAPRNSTSFAAAMDDGRVELWDLSEKPLDPLVVHYPRDLQHQRKRTCVRFSPNSPVLIAGDDQGSVDVMRMYNTDVQYYSDQEQQDRLWTVMVKKR